MKRCGEKKQRSKELKIKSTEMTEIWMQLTLDGLCFGNFAPNY